MCRVFSKGLIVILGTALYMQFSGGLFAMEGPLKAWEETIEAITNRDLPLETRRSAAQQLLQLSAEDRLLPAAQRRTIQERELRLLLSTAADRREDPEIRAAIIRALGILELKSPLAVGQLTPVLLDETENSHVRSWIAMTLPGLGSPNELGSVLLKAAASTDEVVRMNAAGQLGRLDIASDELLKWAHDAMKDPIEQVRVSAVGTAAIKVKGAETEANRDPWMRVLLQGTTDDAPMVRNSAARLLGMLWRESPKIAEHAQQLLVNPNMEVRLPAAVMVINHRGASQEEAKRILIEALQSEDDDIQAAAANAMGLLEEDIEWAISALGPVLAEAESERARIEAAISLIRITGEPARGFRTLVSALGSPTPENHYMAFAYLGYFAPQATEAEHDLLLQSLEDDNVRRRCAILSLLHIAGVDRDRLLKILSDATGPRSSGRFSWRR